MKRNRKTIPTGKSLRASYMYGGYVVLQPGESLAPRTLTDFELVHIIEGQILYHADSVDYEVPPGGIVLGRPGTQETYVWDKQNRTRHAYFHFGLDEIPLDWPPLNKWPRVRKTPNPVLVALFRHIMSHIHQGMTRPAQEPSPGDCRLLESALDTFLEAEHSEDALHLEPDRPEPVRRAVNWMRIVIDEDPRRPVTLADVANAAKVSEKHLCREFARSLGHSPMRVYTLLRLQLALSLLVRSNLSVKELAHRCGFSDAFYFSRCFSKTFDVPPTELRAQIAKGAVPPPNPLPVDITPRVYW